jgi:hypothetical protein
MKFVLRYRPEVVADPDAARCWYEERSVRLGSDFIVECYEAVARIQRDPEWVGVDGYSAIPSHPPLPVRHPLPYRRRDDRGLRNHVWGPRSVGLARADIIRRWIGRRLASSGVAESVVRR